jgi:CheY-like chemotaxis protein
LTPNDPEDVRDRCLDAGMDDCLGKPFQQHVFQKVLECWLLKKPARDDTVDLQEETPASSGSPVSEIMVIQAAEH